MARSPTETELRCCACDQRAAFDPLLSRCPRCEEAMEIVAPSGPLPPPDRLSAAGARRHVGPSGNASAAPAAAEWSASGVSPGSGLWRFRQALPPIDATVVGDRISLGEGGTPLLESRSLAQRLGCRRLWLKDESRNPTGSFKDRGTAVAVAILIERGHEEIGTVSTGNMARSVAAYGARAGLQAHVWVGSGTPAYKLAPITVHGARLARFTAPYGSIYAASLAWGKRRGIPFVNSDSALRVEGQKTIAFELAEQLGWRAPDWLLIPTSSGGNLAAIAKGFAEAVDWGWITAQPRLVAVQAAGCAPIATAWGKGSDVPAAVGEPRTVAGAISNPTPPSGARALRCLRRTEGRAIAVDDEQIVAAQRELAAHTGRFVQPAAAASLAAARRLRRENLIGSDDEVVLLLTGAGSNAPPPELPVPEPVELEHYDP